MCNCKGSGCRHQKPDLLLSSCLTTQVYIPSSYELSSHCHIVIHLQQEWRISIQPFSSCQGDVRKILEKRSQTSEIEAKSFRNCYEREISFRPLHLSLMSVIFFSGKWFLKCIWNSKESLVFNTFELFLWHNELNLQLWGRKFIEHLSYREGGMW